MSAFPSFLFTIFNKIKQFSVKVDQFVKNNLIYCSSLTSFSAITNSTLLQ